MILQTIILAWHAQTSFFKKMLIFRISKCFEIFQLLQFPFIKLFNISIIAISAYTFSTFKHDGISIICQGMYHSYCSTSIADSLLHVIHTLNVFFLFSKFVFWCLRLEIGKENSHLWVWLIWYKVDHHKFLQGNIKKRHCLDL